MSTNATGTARSSDTPTARQTPSPDQVCEIAAGRLALGDIDNAERLCRAVLDFAPFHYGALVLSAQICERRGRTDEALALYDQAVARYPAAGLPFTRRTLLRLRRVFGAPLPPRVAPPGPRVQMSSLGANGRFGNQLLQYAFLRLFAEARGLSAETPDWIGRDLFDLDDPLPSGRLTPLSESDADLFAALDGNLPGLPAEADLSGYFCGPTSAWGARRERFRSLFVPGARFAPLFERAMATLRGKGRTVVALHVRRGDFGYGRFWVAPVAWYVEWLTAIWPGLDSPVLYVATDDPSCLAGLRAFSPVDAEGLGVDFADAAFALDHHVLREADHLAVSNSSFSFTAAMLNARAASFVRPDPDRRRLVAFEPWNAPVLLDPAVDPAALAPEQRAFLDRSVGADATVVHVGRFCGPWTNLVRSVRPGLKVHEIEPEHPVDALRERAGLGHINHLVVEDANRLDEILDGARRSLRYARIDIIQFRLDAPLARAALDPLRLAMYRLCRLTRDGIAPADDGPVLGAGCYAAIQERLIPLMLGLPPAMHDLGALSAAHGVRPKGVIHVGAHEGAELAAYKAMGVERVLFVEANPAVYARLLANVGDEPGVVAVNCAITDRPGPVTLNLASFDQASSLLPMGSHLSLYPTIVPSGTVEVPGVTLDGLIAERAFDPAGFNLLNVDVQGAEAMVLAGASETLAHIEAVNIEINFAELYRGCAQIEQIEDRLHEAGFRRVSLVTPYHATWGDAFYVRERAAPV